jgi:hypothetical protein
MVLAEISQGDLQAAQLRRQLVESLRIVEWHTGTVALAKRLMQANAVPKSEPEDAMQIALDTLAGFEYLVTWNFSHFVGPQAKYKVFKALTDWGYRPALFATPEELLEQLS